MYLTDHRVSFWLCILVPTDPTDRICMPACPAESCDLVGKRAYPGYFYALRMFSGSIRSAVRCTA